MRRARAALVAVALLSAPAAFAEEPSRALGGASLERSPLADLIGDWDMRGRVGGSAVTYSAHAEWALAGAFLRLELTDTAKPPAYQAAVFIGWDEVSERFVCHWLDGFGARPSQTLGYGVWAGDALTLVFEYPDGPFRTTFARVSEKRWRVEMRTKEGRGPWQTFAEYTLVRRAKP